MMKFDEREIRAAMDRRLSALEASEDRRRAIRLRIGEEEPVVKRKLTVSAALALALIMTLTGVALAAGIVNLFEYFGKEDERLAMVADRAVLETQKPESVETETLGRTVGTIHNAYYDGQTLLVAYSMENARRIEAYMPDEEELKSTDMEQIVYMPSAQSNEEERIINEYADKVKAGEPCGLVIYSVYTTDHSYANGVDLGPATEMENDGTDGVRYMLREYETPLPEAIQNQDFLMVEMPLNEHTTRIWFDGKATWVAHENTRDAGKLSAAVVRTEADNLRFSGVGEYEGVEVQARATLSAVRGEVILSGTAAFPERENGHYDFEIYDGLGNRYRPSSMTVNHPDEICISFNGNGVLPEELSLVICIESEYDIRPRPVTEPIVLTAIQ